MTRGSSILAYLVFSLGRTSTERMARPISTIVWDSPEARLGVQGKARRTRPSQIRTYLGFIQTVFICNWLREQSRDPSFAYKRMRGRSSSPKTLFSIFHPSAQTLDRSSSLARSNLRHHCNHAIEIIPAIKSDKQDIGRYPTRGPNLGKPVFPCVV
jgi:hypothetical protein